MERVPKTKQRIDGATEMSLAFSLSDSDISSPSLTPQCMPRTVNLWPRTFSLGNVARVLSARRNGATVSLNQVKLKHSVVERNALIMEYAMVWQSSVGRYSIIGRYASIFNTDVGPFSGLA